MRPKGREFLERQGVFEVFLKHLQTEISQDFHTQFTPITLCDEIIDKIPSLEGDILVVSNIEFVYALLKRGVSAERICFATPCAKKARFVGVFGITQIYTYEYGRLQESLMGAVGAKRFDVVIGNPPYHKSTGNTKNPKYLWPWFMSNSFNMITDRGCVVMIVPRGWTTNAKLYSLLLKNHPIVINIDECARHFPTVNSTFSYFVVSKIKQVQSLGISIITKQGTTTIGELPDSGLGIVDNDAFGIMVKIADQPKVRMVTSSGYNSSKFSTGCNTVSKTRDGTHPYKILHAINASGRDCFYSSHLDVTTYNVPRVICSVWLSRWSDMFVSKTELTSQDFRHFPTNTIQEAHNLRELLQSKLYIFIATILSSSNRLTNNAVEHFPYVDLTRSWTNEELYKYFNLTQQEIQLIEETVK